MSRPRPDGETRTLSVTGHLEELRRTLLAAMGCWLAATLVSFFFAGFLIAWCKFPARDLVTRFVLLKPTEIIAVYFKLALYAGGVLASPALIFFAWKFIRPALPPGPKPPLLGWLTGAAALFAAGTAFAYWVLVPAALHFLLGLSRAVAEPMLTLNFYVSFVLAILLLGGGVFQIPIVVGALTQAGLLTPKVLRRRRREVLFVMLVAAAVLTPTTDVFNLVLFALPMVLLYELGILLSAGLESAKNKKHPGEEAYP